MELAGVPGRAQQKQEGLARGLRRPGPEPGQRVGRWLGRPAPGQPEVVLLGLGPQGYRSRGLSSGKSEQGQAEMRTRVNSGLTDTKANQRQINSIAFM